MAKYGIYVEDVSVEALFNKMGGVEKVRAYLRDEYRLVPHFTVWRTVKVASGKEVPLARATVTRLTGKDSATMQEIFNAIEGGLASRLDVGIALREEYSDQPKGERIWLVVGPAGGDSSGFGVLSIARDSDGLRSMIHHVISEYEFPGESEFVFPIF